MISDISGENLAIVGLQYTVLGRWEVSIENCDWKKKDTLTDGELALLRERSYTHTTGSRVDW
jgi:hypothetical protein